MDGPDFRQRWDEIRRAAEAELGRAAASAEGAPERADDPRRLAHELRVYQAELEMQNEELRAAQIEATQANDRYRRLYELAPVGFVTMDRSGRVRDCNAWAAKLLGVPRSEIVDRPLQRFLSERAADGLHRHLRDLFASGGRQACELTFARGDAPERSASVRFESVVLEDDAADADGRTLCQSALIDLSEIRAAQAGRATSEARTTAILETVADAVVSSDASGNIESFNAAAERLFGYDAVEVVGRNVSLLMPPPYRDDHPGFIRRYLSTGDGRIIGKAGREVEGLTKDGRLVPLYLTIGEWSNNGERRFTAIMRDETARKASAAYLREERDFAERLLETAPVIVLVLDGEGRVLRVNRCFEALTGYDIDEVRGADWFATVLPEVEHERVRDVFARTLRQQNTSGTVNAIRTKRGSTLEIEWHNTLLRDARGRVAAVMAIGLDVTKRRQIEEAQRLEAVGELAAGVAHEINNPVNTMVNCAQLVVDGDPAAENCQIIIEEGARITAIVKDLLQFARDDRGAPQPSSLAEVVGRTVRLMGENFKRHGIRLQVDVPADLPLVLAHPQKLQQVLLNLLINAKEALQGIAAHERRRVVVSAKVEPGIGVSCCVHDDGPGIPPELIGRIFEPFVTTKRARGGTGLGLSVSRSIVESFGGRLTVLSAPGEYTDFTFTLPLAPAP